MSRKLLIFVQLADIRSKIEEVVILIGIWRHSNAQYSTQSQHVQGGLGGVDSKFFQQPPTS
ncbi:MAG: hypothetical protein ACI4NJ_03270 [Cellvibrio sp.]